jgi:acetyltransferase
MPIHNFDKLFYPSSIAVIGANNRKGELGNVVMLNLLHGGFEGPIMPVTDRERAVAGVYAYPNVEALPVPPDLAVICNPLLAGPEMISALGESGSRAAIVLGAARDSLACEHAKDDCNAMLREAARFGLRVLGPGCLGLMVPHIGLNASMAEVSATPGGIAFVSQSATVCAAVLDWARERDIGFAHFVSLGRSADICFGDVIDYLGNDAMTKAILLYIENVRSGRTFMSAGRGASRNKPIVVIKAGRTLAGERTAGGENAPHGADAVYDAVFRRAGMLRVDGLNELFSAVETLGRTKPLRGERLGIVANGRGIAAMAVDALIAKDGRLAIIGEASRGRLRQGLPAGQRIDNPVILNGIAAPEHYALATRALLKDGGVDAVMVLHAPIDGVSSTKVAQAVVAISRETRGTLLTSWMGGERVAAGRRLLAEAGIPTYDTPNQAVDAFMHMVQYRRNQVMLMQTPASTPTGFTPATERAKRLVEDLLLPTGSTLLRRDALALLSTYGIDSADARKARSPEEAAAIAAEIGRPLALRLLANDERQKTEDDVALFLEAPDAVKVAAERLQSEALARSPGARIEGFLVEPVTRHPGTLEVKLGVVDDPVFGPVITFAHGGAAGELTGHSATGLPPLSMTLAHEMVARTHISQLLQRSGDAPGASLQALCLTLVQISQLIVDIPEVAALSIDPLRVDHRGVIAVDARIVLVPRTGASEDRLAIRPYPKELEEEFVLTSGRNVLIRPIRPEDEAAHHAFHDKCTAEDMRLRFFHPVRTLPHAEMARLTQIDYDREMAFVATAPKEDGSGFETLGVVRTIADLSNEKAEYAIMVRSDLKGQRLGRKLTEKILQYCRSRGIREVVAEVLPVNERMLGLLTSLGFKTGPATDEDCIELTLDLQEPVPQPDAAYTNLR